MDAGQYVAQETANAMLSLLLHNSLPQIQTRWWLRVITFWQLLHKFMSKGMDIPGQFVKDVCRLNKIISIIGLDFKD